ncbi:hypothetical protein [Sphingomonas sp. Leaf30]|uniref:hypothetical protein n=1 Tax=Sphingomonas sp. Leaf30 TaxID=1736213 RepID=UPI0006FEA725|nr:hypothetical protein [Sphingomonas sp. Leaf30]KQN14091.1 hypothetical protein ASE89_10050 [Sphingomonas sp. Leaf30]
MPADFDTSPGIHAMLYRYRPSRRPGQRIISLESPDSFDRDLIEAVARELDVPAAAASLDAGEVAALATAADSARRRFGDDAGVSLALQRLLTSRGGALDAEIALVAITGHAHHGGILKTFPGMVGSAAMIEAIIEGAPLGAGAGLHHRIDVNALVIRHLDQARRAIPVAETRWDDLLPTYIVAAMAQGLGWTRWVKLFATLSDNAEIADDTDPSDPETRQWETDDSLRMRREALAEILPDHAVRKVARLVLDLRGVLANSGPDVRLVYLQRLRSAIGDDDDLRRATIEALLSRGPSRERDLVLFASTRLVETGDEAFISELVNHPDRDVGYLADIVRHAVFGAEVGDGAWPTPTVSAIADGLFQIGLMPAATEHPLTWIGDRLLERLIEQTVASEERRFAQEYRDHSEEGEEGLLRSFFSDLAHRLRALGDGLRAAAHATGSDRVTSIQLNYRPVDKSEEGKPGVNPRGDAEPPSFSADLCLIVDPYLDGRSLGKRVTLVQAKRLRLKDTARPSAGLATSFKLEPKQMTDLLRQTGSSFYLFQCPGLLDRGVPMMPTQLVEDLARHHAASAAQIPAGRVGPASRPFADWLTYMVLALRTGDPLAELVEKAEGSDGRRPRPLARFGTVEIALHVGEPKGEAGEGVSR